MKRVVLGLLLATACGSSGDDSSPASSADGGRAVKRYFDGQLGAWQAGLEAIVAEAPTGRAWDPVQDRDRLARLRTHWRSAHAAYQAVQSTVGQLLPDVNALVDQRYERMLSPLNFDGDDQPFDDAGITGMHAIERILWADAIPKATVEREEILTAYAPPRFPASAAEADDFRTKLVGALIAKVKSMRQQFAPIEVDVGFGVRSIADVTAAGAAQIAEAAGWGNEESRYSHTTLADVRAGQAACRELWAVLDPQVTSRPGGSAAAASIARALGRMGATLAAQPGDGLPLAPPTWRPSMLGPEELMTPFGKLYGALADELDPKRTDSLVNALEKAAVILAQGEKK